MNNVHENDFYNVFIVGLRTKGNIYRKRPLVSTRGRLRLVLFYLTQVAVSEMLHPFKLF